MPLSKSLSESIRQACSRDHETSARMNLCVDALSNGYIESFVEFFQLAHRPPICVDPLSNELFSLSSERDMILVQKNLVEAEERKRRSEYRSAHDHYTVLATFFENHKDLDTAQHFYSLAVSSSRTSPDRELEVLACEALGAFYDRTGKYVESIKMYETILRIGETLMILSIKQKSYKALARVYTVRAAILENDGPLKYAEAQEMYTKALQSARACGDTEQEGVAYMALGSLNTLIGDLSKALEYQKRFLLLSRQENNARNETKAAGKVAELQEQLGQVDDALESLRQAVSVAEESDDIDALCRSYRKLGELYLQNGDATNAIHYLRQLFDVTLQQRDTSGTDYARILLGIAGAFHTLSDHVNSDTNYVTQVHQNPQYLLDRKKNPPETPMRRQAYKNSGTE